MNWATNDVAGRSYTSFGVPTCCSLPAFITAIREPIVIASTWSWVTYRNVLSSRACSSTSSARVSPRSLASRLRQRLVHAEHRRVAHDRPGEGDALALAAAELAGLAVEQAVEAERRGRHLGLRGPLGAADAADLERELDVRLHGLVRVQRVALEDHRHVALLRRDVVDPPVADVHVAARRVLQAGDHPQQRALAAARRPEEDHELVVGDVERHVVDRVHRVRARPERLGDPFQSHLRHERTVRPPGREYGAVRRFALVVTIAG